jgi:hypothetical protein
MCTARMMGGRAWGAISWRRLAAAAGGGITVAAGAGPDPAAVGLARQQAPVRHAQPMTGLEMG